MNLFNTVSSRLTKAVDYIVEKNRKAALINRIRIVIKNERENEARAYVALGKYYFQNMRDNQNEETERLCKAVETSDQRIKKAFDKLDEITAIDDIPDEACSGCSDDCDYCSCSDYNNMENISQEDEEYIDSDEYSLNSIVDKANENGFAADQAAQEAACDEQTVYNQEYYSNTSDVCDEKAVNDEAADDEKEYPII